MRDLDINVVGIKCTSSSGKKNKFIYRYFFIISKIKTYKKS